MASIFDTSISKTAMRPNPRWTPPADGAPAEGGYAGAAPVPGAKQQSGLALYCNGAEEPYPDPGSEAWCQRMKAAISRDGRRREGMSYVFGPQAFVANVSIDKKELGDRNDGNDGKEKCASRVFHGQEGARTELEVLVEETRVCVRHRHVKFGLSLVSWMENVFALKDLRSLLAAGALGPGERRGGRPTHPVLAHAREWWGFAVTCVLLRYRKDAARLRLDAVRCSVQRCKQYIELYERKSCEGRPWLRELSSKEMRRVSDIETHPDTHFRELVVWRCIAWERLCAADAEHRQQQSKRSKKKDEVQYRMTREQLKMLDGGGNSPGC